MSVIRLPLTSQAGDARTQQALNELKRGMENRFQYGTAAPSSDTPGYVYYQIGAATTDAITTYIKIGGQWYGG